MNRGFGLRVILTLTAATVCLLGVTLAYAQAAPQEKPLMADDIFKNIQVLRGLTVDQFMGTMGFIAAALSMNCSECHHTGSPADETDGPQDDPHGKWVEQSKFRRKTDGHLLLLPS